MTTHIAAVSNENPFLTFQEKANATQPEVPNSIGTNMAVSLIDDIGPPHELTISQNDRAQTIQRKPVPDQKIGERTFSDALDSFFARARRSSYDYKIGP